MPDNESENAGLLRRFWHSPQSMEYEGQWIIFAQGEVVANSEWLEDILERSEELYSEYDEPIYAFVTHEAIG